MSENDETTTDAPEPPAAPEPEAPAPAPAPRRTLRERFAGTGDRVYGVRGLIAATLAALIVGGFGGAAIHAAVDGDRHERGPFFRGERPGDMGRDFGGRMGWGERPDGPGDYERHAPPGFPGPVPPTTSPDDEETSPTPTPSESSDS